MSMSEPTVYPSIRELIYQVLAPASAADPMTTTAITDAIILLSPRIQPHSVLPRLTKEYQSGALGRTQIKLPARRSIKYAYAYWIQEPTLAQPADGELSDAALFEGNEAAFPEDIPDLAEEPEPRDSVPDTRRNNLALPFTIQASNIGLIHGITIHGTPDGIPTEIVIELTGSEVAADRAVHAALQEERMRLQDEVTVLRARLTKQQTMIDGLQPLAEQAARMAAAARSIERG